MFHTFIAPFIAKPNQVLSSPENKAQLKHQPLLSLEIFEWTQALRLYSEFYSNLHPFVEVDILIIWIGWIATKKKLIQVHSWSLINFAEATCILEVLNRVTEQN